MPDKQSDLIPGSPAAQQYGCSCDEEKYNVAGLVNIDCPLHGLLSDEQHQTETS